MAESEHRRFDDPPSEGSAHPAPLRPDPLGQALHAVPVPTGLQERLLASLSSSDPPVHLRNGGVRWEGRRKDDARHDPDAFPSLPARRQPRFSRRRWLAGALACGVGGALFGTYAWLRRPLPEATLVAMSRRWAERLEAGGKGGWNRVKMQDGAPVPTDNLPIPTVLPPQEWRYLDTELSSRTVVYSWRSGDERVYLFALKTWRDLSSLKSAPPNPLPPNQTGGWVVGAWQADACLYVIALPESVQGLFYPKLLEIHSSQMA